MKKILLKILPILFALLLLSCKEELGKKEWECNAACEDRRKEFERSIDSVHIEKYNYDVLVTKTATGGFGEPISDIELSTNEIYFSLYGIRVTRTKTGAIANSYTELSIGEWLDFIRALYKLRFINGKDNMAMICLLKETVLAENGDLK